ncbi:MULTISPECIES: hypothetical protein [unclassified Lysobacter]|uniref:hypothetical protein n=1 Tax=unclassified Lysobacter TaxID=2635362 RepID=UPI001BE81D96|nr:MULTISPECIES: hypothetical protein [unclassified Lysobacter]MBT2744967.1 hypothetical protein [Lysobacter sp. ISL-42]MBT2752040.1 hypothetical protein [Lysobacter sp. ISL-50]MBT2778537.1 hypothetical protein [Lysobacter sp. ISL-54]MBT2780532.1 hypothetical protein [Lysobacter sp. ISL-52]
MASTIAQWLRISALLFAWAASPAQAAPPLDQATLELASGNEDTDWRIVEATGVYEALGNADALAKGITASNGLVRLDPAQLRALRERYLLIEKTGATTTGPRLWLVVNSNPKPIAPRWSVRLMQRDGVVDSLRAARSLDELWDEAGAWRIVATSEDLARRPEAIAQAAASAPILQGEQIDAIAINEAEQTQLWQAQQGACPGRLWLITDCCIGPVGWQWTMLDVDGRPPPKPELRSPLPATVDPVAASAYADWVRRFTADYSASAKRAGAGDDGIAQAFANSVAPDSLALAYLRELAGQQQLHGASVHAQIATAAPGRVVAEVIGGSVFAGSAGPHPGADFGPALPAKESFEGVYVWFASDDEGKRSIQSALQSKWQRDTLRVPAEGSVERDAFPLLIFRRIDGKLYLAAFTREFQAIVEPLYQPQWF